MKKLLVTGISGFLGHYILNDPQQEWEIVGTYFQQDAFAGAERHHYLDLADSEAIRLLVDEIDPAAILHVAACSQPNFCEQHPEVSRKVNLEATQVLCQEAKKRQIPFVFTSTDLVFDGLNSPYVENDEPTPVSRYGQQKAAAEQFILQEYPSATVARMPLMYGMTPQKPGFMGNWLKQFEENKKVYAFSDEYRTAVSGRDGAAGLFLLLSKGLNGIWHLGGEERMSRYTFACLLAEVFGYSKKQIQKSLQSDVQMAAARPPDTSLDSSKAFALGYRPERTKEALQRISKNQNNAS